MGIEKVLFKSEEKKSSSEIAADLRLIADKVESGGLTLKQGQETVQLDLPDTMTLEIKAEEESGRQTKRSLEIELEWVPGQQASGTTEII
ncbi:MAG: amphi-Trp domain-containing protein [Desulfohalobiaceae bacterium]